MSDIIKVALLPGAQKQLAREISIEFSYLVDESIKAPRGSFVNVPFGKGNRVATAIVTKEGVKYEENTSLRYTIKNIIEVNNNIPGLSEKQMDLAEKISHRYLCSFGEAVQCLIPPSHATSQGKTIKVVYSKLNSVQIKTRIAQNLIKNIKQIQFLEYLDDYSEDNPAIMDEVTGAVGCGPSVAKTLEEKGYIVIEKRKIAREHPAMSVPDMATYSKHILNTRQKAAYDKLVELCNRDEFAQVLLHGVTGSGKTEVYLQIIEYILGNGGNTILLVPEISLTPQMVAHLAGRFGDKVAVIHSRLTPSQRADQYNRIREGKVKVAVGARSAVFAPFDKVDMLILDEEHEHSYNSDNPPRYRCWEVAAMRGAQDKAVVVYGSATPSIEKYHKALNKEIFYLPLKERCNNNPLPEVTIVNMAEELKQNGGPVIFSRALHKALKENLDLGMQSILFVPRRGYSKNITCMSCGKAMKCSKCNVSMTYHSGRNMLICHYCGNAVILPPECPECGGELKSWGLGTESVQQELERLFPGAEVLRMDTDTTSVKDGHSKILTRFATGKVPFLVGTQMIAKGHDFPKVTLVGVLSADSLINMPDYNAGERAFQLLTQVAGRAGRAQYEGKVFVQAYDVDDYSISSAVKQDYERFYRNDIIIRQSLRYPPFCGMCTFRCAGENDKKVFDYIKECSNKMRYLAAGLEYGRMDIEVLGPVRDVVPKINNKYRWCVIIKADTPLGVRDYMESFLKDPPKRTNEITEAIIFE